MTDLRTARLVLHAMTPEEAERIVAGKPGEGDLWGPEYPDAMDVEGATDLLKACATTGDPRPFGNYEIRRRLDGRAVGGLGFNRVPDADGTVTIGYSLNASVRGRGYASEALRALLDFAWSRGVTLVKADADLGNLASQRVMRAVGMREVGEDHRVRYFELAAPAGAAQPLPPSASGSS
ncbi:GNAT family N-acetyltransferase [Streptomyces albus subsp. chlorinus]|uniref:GNAT family N-acetyltransferase n=1 Tax=Streptomyces albus TaxID=1888 RepID=UPI00156FBFE0|nr:GNAT family N-acetyltransferase [Streptomyces albus]NSC20556.1 GNAT family N-acetyltransferase [Streptomyces albus subsp. chlorinus]